MAMEILAQELEVTGVSSLLPTSAEENKEKIVEEMETIPASESGVSTSSLTSSPTSPLLPLPDFMTALNMKPQPVQSKDAEQEGVKKAEEKKLVLGPGPKEVLIEKFKHGMFMRHLPPASCCRIESTGCDINKRGAYLSTV